MIQARSYQIEAVSSIYNYFAVNAGNPVVAMPTGTGKSVVIAMFLESVFRHYPDQKILCLTHVKELIEQNYLKLLSVWPNAPAGVYSAGLKRRDTINKIIFAGIASVAKRASEFGFVNLILIDEAHLVSPSEETLYRTFIDALKQVNPHLKVIGLTATPWRLGHGKIIEDGIFTDLCFDITGLAAFNRLIAEGYLSPLIPKRTTTTLDTDGVHSRGGEFIASELQMAVDKSEISFAAIKEAMELGYDRKHWLVFCAGVEHAIHVSDMLNAMGISCKAVHSKLAPAERDAAIADFKAGRIQALTNNNVLTTGFDFPGIDLILMLRPTQSPVLWVQMLGRGTRPLYAPGFDVNTLEGRLAAISASEKQNCLVLDFAGNTKRLGPINDPVIPRKKGQKTGEAPVKLCECCGTYNHASARYCGGQPFPTVSGCGHEFKIMTKLRQHASTYELIKGEVPIVEVFAVESITITRHQKHDKPPAMKVSYYCGLKHFEDYVCIEHEGFAARKARMWWMQRSANPCPVSTDEAIVRSEELRVPSHLRVWVNKKYPEIMEYCYDGTAFNTIEPSEAFELPKVTLPTTFSKPSIQEPEKLAPSYDDLSDDIPF